MKILRIEHVQVAIPLGGQDRARAFYSGVLGFSEIQKPASMAERKSIWFVAGAVNLHLGIEADFHPAKRDRKSTRLNSSHDQISYAVFCLKKKKSLEARDAEALPRPGPLHLLPSRRTVLAARRPDSDRRLVGRAGGDAPETGYPRLRGSAPARRGQARAAAPADR